MTPRQVDELHPDEYRAMILFANREAREQRRAAARAQRRKR
jgi:hypothetical protein